MIAAKLRHKDLVISSSDWLPFIACTAAPVISGHGNCNRRYKEKIARTGILISNGKTHKQKILIFSRASIKKTPFSISLNFWCTLSADQYQVILEAPFERSDQYHYTASYNHKTRSQTFSDPRRWPPLTQPSLTPSSTAGAALKADYKLAPRI